MRKKGSLALIALSLLLVVVVFANSSPPSLQAIGGGTPIAITDSGFDPAVVTILPGESVHWTNESGDIQTVISDSGLFDSGNLAPGAGFSIGLAIPGVHTYRSTSTDFTAEVRVVLEALSGPPDEPANNHIPDITFPPQSDDDIGIHPDFGFLASRTRILVGFPGTATVAQVNGAIQNANVVIIGGLPNSEILLVSAEDTLDFSALTAAIGALRTDSAVEFATMSAELELQVVPRLAETKVADDPTDSWQWDLVPSLGGNWGLKTSRFPQAWNLLEAIQRRDNKVKTGVIDFGFENHLDLQAVDLTPLCKKWPDGQEKCTRTNAQAHGNHVAGIIGAEFNNIPDGEQRSLGVSGGNPAADITAVSNLWVDKTNGVYFAGSVEAFDHMIGTTPELRVINFSIGLKIPGLVRSPAGVADASGWWNTHGVAANCGPGINDDETAVANLFCTPNNEDSWLQYVAGVGAAQRNVAEFAGQNGVIIVQAAGNDGNFICIGSAPDSGDCQYERVHAENLSGFGWAANNWVNVLEPNPIVVVEAIGPNLNLIAMSNDGGNISAPGEDIVSTVLGDDYGKDSGTSMAAPHVAALIGYMFAYGSSLTVEDIIDRLIAWADPITPDGGAPRMDAFAPLLSIPGAAKDLVDVSDPSEDGNQRVVLGQGPNGGVEESFNLLSSDENVENPATKKPYLTEPDGKTDMRDFRRYRDAWLLKCLLTFVGAGDCGAFASPAEISLNGLDIGLGAPHPKLDLNFDGCVSDGVSDPNCLPPEHELSRFDFNGDGEISRLDLALVPLQPDGTVAVAPFQAVNMTDLDVMKSQWETDTNDTEGYTKDDLPELMVSGDLEIHTNAFFDLDAPDADIFVKRLDTNELLPPRTISSGEDFIIVTVPANVDLEVTASGITTGGDSLESPIEELNLKAGEDYRLDVCSETLSLSANPPIIFANGSSESEIVAEYISCAEGVDVSGFDVEFGSTPFGGNHGFVDFELDVTGADGLATTTFTAGTEVADYDVTGTLVLGDGRTIAATVTLKTSDPVKIAYRWQQTVLDFTEAGTTRWQELTDPDFDPNFGDCDDDTFLIGDTVWDVEGWQLCVEQFNFEATPIDLGFGGFLPQHLELQREGLLEQAGNEVLLDEFVTDSTISGNYAFDMTFAMEPLNKIFHFASEMATKVAADQFERYQDYALSPDASIVLDAAGLHLSGLNEAAELEYIYESGRLEAFTTFTDDLDNIVIDTVQGPLRTFNVAATGFERVCIPGRVPECQDEEVQGFTENIAASEDGVVAGAGVHRPELMLVPRGDGSALRFSGDVTQPITFGFDGDGGFRKYEYCEVVARDYEVEPAYQSTDDFDKPTFQDRGRLWQRNRTYEGTNSALNESPTPVGPSHSEMRYSFVALPYVNEEDLQELILTGGFEPSEDCAEDQVPVASFGFSPVAPTAGQSVHFLNFSTSLGNSIVSSEWDFGDNGMSFFEEPNHVYNAAGTYTVKLTVRDASGASSSASGQITIGASGVDSPVAQAFGMTVPLSNAIAPQVEPAALPSDPPVPAFVIDPARPIAGELVTVRNASRDGSGQPIGAVLDLGDGSALVSLDPGAFRQHTYANDGQLTMSLTASNGFGGLLTVARDIQVQVAAPPPPLLPGDFNLTISPSLLELAPETSTNFIVNLASINGFDSLVDLSISGLPSGVTGQFNPAQVQPSNTSLLTLTADANPTTGQFEFNVTAKEINGDIAHTTSSSVKVEFGLIPICTGTYQGTVTDVETGLPLPGVEIKRLNSTQLEVVTDEAGHYVLTPIPLGLSNEPLFHNLETKHTLGGYWRLTKGDYAACGEIVTIDFQMIPIHLGSASGTVFVGVPDPNDLSRNREVTPSDVPLEGAVVSNLGGTSATTDANGSYEFNGLLPNKNNLPKTSLLVVDKAGFWRALGPNVTIEGDAHTDIPDVGLVPMCTANISGTLVFGDTGLPAESIRVDIVHPFSSLDSVFTNANGEFFLPDKLLGLNNSSATYNAKVNDRSISHPGYLELKQDIFVERCDDDVVVALELVAINSATLQGHIFDEDTGDPIANAGVSFSSSVASAFTQTDQNGAYLMEDIKLGQLTSAFGSVNVSHADYLGGSATATLSVDQTTTVDFGLVLRKFGFIAGTVTDAASELPIEGATFSFINIPGATGPDGKYQSGPLSLSAGNQPALYGFRTRAPGYWDKLSLNISVSADDTADNPKIVDVDLIPVCQGATIVGSVINATTGEAIEGVFVRAFSSPSVSAFTDADGNFILEDVTVGTDNSPLLITVQASKSGFLTQSKTVTVFCGASIVLGFGEPTSAPASIEGTVVNLDDAGAPIPGVFIGSEFGASTTTDSQGHYSFNNVPLSAGDGDREWDITAAPNGFPPLAKSVTALADQTVRLDFSFSAQADDPTNNPPELDLISDQTLGENATLDIDLSAFDPDGDDLTLSVVALPLFGVFTDNGDGTGSISLAPGSADVGTYLNVEVTATDDEGLSDTVSFSIVVENVNSPPIADADGPYIADEGAAFILDGSGSSDSDGDDLTYQWDLGGDSFFESLVEITLDDDFDGTAQLTVDDGNGGTDTASASVTVLNVAPSVDAGTDQTVNEGDTVSLAPATFSDAGILDTHTATINWGDNTGTETGSVSGGTVSGSHVYDDDGIYTVTVTVTDDDGGEGEGTLMITVLNVAPTVTATGSVISENGIADVSGSIVDPGLLDGFSVTIDWGEGVPTLLNLPAGTTSYSATHHYLDDNPTATPSDNYAIRVEVQDDDGGSDEDSAVITVVNLAPGLGQINSETEVMINSVVTLSGSYTDLGSRDTHTVEIDWADGTVEAAIVTPDGNGGGLFTLSHQFTAAQSYSIEVTVTDDDTGSDSAYRNITVRNIPVRIPGRMTGGGSVGLVEGSTGRGKNSTPLTTHGFTVVYDEDGIMRGNLQFNDHRSGDNFHVTSFTDIAFVDDPAITPGGNVRFDTALVSGVGRLRTGTGGVGFNARFTAVITDAGEPGSNDVFEIEFPDGESLGIQGTLSGGNHQAHQN